MIMNIFVQFSSLGVPAVKVYLLQVISTYGLFSEAWANFSCNGPYNVLYAYENIPSEREKNDLFFLFFQPRVNLWNVPLSFQVVFLNILNLVS